MTKRRRTATSNFGVGARESHDATAFYDRFRPPDAVRRRHGPAAGAGRRAVRARRRPRAWTPSPTARWRSSSRRRRTSPASSTRRSSSARACRRRTSSTSQMLTDVFAECVRTLEPGGRIAVNVANLGRKPYRSLSADVIRILEHDLGLLLRGELIWQKARGRQRLVRVGLVPQRGQPGAARHHRAGRRRQQGPLRPGPHRPSSAPPRACRTRARCSPTTSSPSRSTCGRSRRRAPGGSATRRRSRSSCPSS